METLKQLIKAGCYKLAYQYINKIAAAEMPIADSFCHPLSCSGYEYRNNVGFLGASWDGSIHPGIDSIYPKRDSKIISAIANGKVINTGSYDTWGNVVLIEHKLPDNKKCWSQYAHFSKVKVNDGQIVKKGQTLGSMGNGERSDGREFKEHLHWEVRKRKMSPQNWPEKWSAKKIKENYYHPMEFIREQNKENKEAQATAFANFVEDAVTDKFSTPYEEWDSYMGRRTYGDSQDTSMENLLEFKDQLVKIKEYNDYILYFDNNDEFWIIKDDDALWRSQDMHYQEAADKWNELVPDSKLTTEYLKNSLRKDYQIRVTGK